MNLSQTPKEKLPLGRFERRHIKFNKSYPIMTITKFTVSIPISQDGNFGVYITREEAIRISEAILTAYNVPFCNRVKGSGTDAV
jgi:hypothetical protein